MTATGTLTVNARSWVIVGLCAVMVFIAPRPAEALLETSAPVVARVALGVPTPLTLGITAVGLGAWFAWSNRDTIRSWFDGRAVIGGSITRPLPSGLDWYATPPPTLSESNDSLPFTMVRVGASMNVVLEGRCFTPSGTPGGLGVLSGFGAIFSGTTGGSSGAVGTLWGGGNFSSFCTGPSMIADVQVRDTIPTPDTIILTWRAPAPVFTQRDSRVRVMCRDRLNTTLEIVGPTTTRTASGTTAQSATVPNCPGVLPDSHQERVTVEDRRAGSADAWSPIINDEIPAAQNTATSQYADCVFNSGGTPCQLAVHYLGQPCSVARSECADWATRAVSVPGYTCRWGPYTITMTDCNVLEHQYKPDAGDATETDPGIGTAPGAVPGTVGTGTTTTNNPDGSTTQTQLQPANGTTPQQRVTTLTRPDGSRQISTQPLNPDGSPLGAPSVVEIPAPPQVGVGVNPDVGDGSSCISAAFTFNPVDWVYVPVKCALQWAFVPSGAAIASKLEAFRSGLATKAPWAFILAGPPAIGALVAGIDTPAACGGAQITDSVLVLPMNTAQPWCALESDDGFGPFTVGAMRNVAIAGIWIVFAWSVYRRAQRLIGAEGPPITPAERDSLEEYGP